IVSHDRDFLDKVCTSLLYMKGDGTITEYVGTYSDLLAGEKEKARQIAMKKNPVKKVVKATDTVETAQAPTPKKKLSFKEQHLLKTLPTEIEKLQTQVASLETKLHNPDFYTKNPEEFNKTTIELTNAKEQLEAAEMMWLELEILQEEINQNA
ncbi:MAG: ABC transporter ATP-binding protein, partial [Alphaproteobacteria bacterium]|nr:ABC transporter ATP-binding protein [Alphaproteobacteria bacterium]